MLKRLLSCLLPVGVMLITTAPAVTGSKSPDVKTPPVVRDREQQVKAALAWLAKNQQPDGGWISGLGENRPAIVVTTSWCALALLASDDQRYLPHVKRAANFVAKNLFKDPHPAPLPENWDQGNWKIAIGGLFLCEYYARLKRDPEYRSPQVQELLASVVKESCQRMEASGGWGHTPRVKNVLGYLELEVMSNWMLATLGAAQRLGIDVPADKLKQGLQYVEDCSDAKNGGVAYSTQKDLKEFGCPCRTGGALFAFGILGKSNQPVYRRMADYWKRERADSGEGHGSVALGLLASSLGARQIGPDAWHAFQRQFFPGILQHGNNDGTFKHLTGKTPQAQGCDHQLGPAYNTGVYALILQLDRDTLHFMGRPQK